MRHIGNRLDYIFPPSVFKLVNKQSKNNRYGKGEQYDLQGEDECIFHQISKLVSCNKANEMFQPYPLASQNSL